MFKSPSMKQVQFVHKLIAERGPLAWMDEDGEWLADASMSDVSGAIGELLAQPVPHADGAAMSEGFYMLDGVAYRVVKAKSSSNLYAKVWNGSWQYAPGAMKNMVKAERLSVEQAAELGRQYGSCVICGRILSDPESVAAGIGPICAGKL